MNVTSRRSCLVAVVLGVFAQIAQCQILVNTTTYTQDFDSLASAGTTWTNNSTLAGWDAFKTGTPGSWSTVGNFYVSNTANVGMHAFGATGSGERSLGAIGGLSTQGTDFYYGAGFRNNLGNVIVGLSISYRGEIWRWGTADSLQSLRFQYSTSAPGIDSSTGWTDVSSLSMSFQHSAIAGEQDGNSTPTSLSGSISGLNLLQGQDIWIRWQDIGDGGVDHGFSVDDLEITFHTASSPVPEPATIALMGLGALAVWRKRKKQLAV